MMWSCSVIDHRRTGRCSATVAALVLAVVPGCGTDSDTGTGEGTVSGEDVSYEVLTTGRRSEAPGGEEINGVQAAVITSQAELDAEWPSWEPLGTDVPAVDGLGTEQSLVLLWAPDHPVRVSDAAVEDGRAVIEGVREVPGEDCAVTAEVTGWTTVVVMDAVPSTPEDPNLKIEQETLDC